MQGGSAGSLKRPLETDGEPNGMDREGDGWEDVGPETNGSGSNGVLKGKKKEDNGSVKLFLEDTVRMKEPPYTVCMVTRTWHDVEDPIEPEDMIFLQRGKGVPPQILTEILTTGQCPKGYAVVTPATLAAGPLIVKETDMEVIDRTFMFGDLVKRSHTDTMSGVVIGVDSQLTIRHCFINEIEEELEDITPGTTPPVHGGVQHPKRRKKRNSSSSELPNSAPQVRGVPETELELTVDWEEGTYVVYRNSWLGVIDRVEKEITIRLDNDTVVIPENPNICYLPFGGQGKSKPAPHGGDGPAPRERERPILPPFLSGGGGGGAYDYSPSSEVPSSVSHCVGQRVETDRSNLRRGRWVYGSYNPAIEPKGMIVRTRTMALGINWITQNIFAAVATAEQPPNWIEEEEFSAVKKFVKSFDGLKGDGTGGGQLQVGDRVQFKDLQAAMAKYDGRSQGQQGNGVVKKYPRELSQGFNLDTFFVESTETFAEVQWQDFTTTRERATTMVPYWNVDEHDAYPGEIVFAKDHIENPNQTNGGPPLPNPDDSSNFALPTQPPSSMDVIRPRKIGVVQTLNAKERVASIRWFEDTTLEVLDSAILPGTRTGTISNQPAEDMSVYELVQHPAVNFRRGDLVLIASTVQVPLSRPDQQNGSSSAPPAPFPLRLSDSDQQMMNDVLRLIHDVRVFGGLGAINLDQFADSPTPQARVIHRLLQLIPPGSDAEPTQEEIMQAIVEARQFLVQADPATLEADWLGEIVDLGLDGLVTVRLGALESMRDVRVPIELLTVIPTEDEDFGPEGGMEDYDSMAEEESDVEVVEEVVYEGGERVEDDGGEEAWTTEDEAGDTEDEDGDEDMQDAGADEVSMAEEVESSSAKPTPSPSKSASPPAPTNPTPASAPTNAPAPEVISLTHSSSISPFLILDTPPPTDHAYIRDAPFALDSAFLRRLSKEHKILRESLPEGIIVRTWENRLDLMRVLIVGPMNTPYELAPFVIDLRCGRRFPFEPPQAWFHSWTGGGGRVNPNLYEDGKICLSLLGTWHSEQKAETWTPKSTLLQLFVSIMGLVLVKDPYYNEAGFTIYVGTAESALNSTLYSEKAYILARNFVRHVLEHPVLGFEEEIRQIYLERGGGMGLLRRVIEGIEAVIARSEKGEEGGEDRRVSLGAVVMLRRQVAALKALQEREEGLSGAEEKPASKEAEQEEGEAPAPAPA